MIVRVRTAEGTCRVDIQSTDTIETLIGRLPEAMQLSSTVSNQPNGSRPFPLNFNVQQCGIKHGDMLYLTSASGHRAPLATPINLDESIVPISKVDKSLDKDDGLIKRPIDSNFCRHGPKAMCDYCMPLEVFTNS
jgi:nuclear protein localization protein 4 homolog